MIGKQPGARRGVHQGLEAMREQIRHAAGAAIFDVVMDRMGVAARGLERGEYRRGLGPARDHEALAEHKILEPALLAHHAVLCGVEVGHGGSSRLGLLDDDLPVSQGRVLRQSVQFVMPGLVPGIHVFKTSQQRKHVDGRDKPGHDEEQAASHQ